MKVLIDHGLVITMDRQRRVIPDGAVLIAGDLIEGVCRSHEVAAKDGFGKVIDARNKAVLPGLVNAHTHLNEKLIPGLRNDLPLGDWLTVVAGPQARATNREDCRISVLLGCLEMVKSGTTCFADMFCQRTERRVMDVVAEAVQASGLRGVLSRYLAEGSALQPKSPGHPSSSLESPIPDDDDYFEMVVKDTLETTNEVRSANRGRIRIRLGPGGMMGFTPGKADRLREIAKASGLGLHTHLAETPEEVKLLRRWHGCGPVVFAHEHGLLGPHVLAAHCIHVTPEEIALLAESRTSVVYNPVANMKLADGVAPIPEMVKRGVNIALGTDGAATNDNLDMFGVMKTGSYLQKLFHQEARLLPSRQVLEMATLNGALALGMEGQIGSLESGKKADIILVNLKDPNLVPTHPQTVINQLVCSAIGSNVETALVDGRIIMENRQVLTLDEEQIVVMAEEASRRLIHRICQRGALFEEEEGSP